MIRGLDNWLTECRVETSGHEPQIIIEARNGRLFVLLGNFNATQARALADLIINKCDEAESQFAGRTEK